ncbi:MAG TPA: hypothetical protein VFL76_05170 [Edaphocola sp.]|nr:hypothetical protein [Edaphocola sp.]
MKRIIFSGLALTFILSGGIVLAQNNANGYTDDVYYNGSKASDAAEQQAVDEPDQNDDTDAAYYNSTGQNYQDSDYANNDDQYIDYDDDDSYAGRIRRFYYPMASVGYWGSVYAPLWMSPYYPYYGWGSGWYGPGFSLSFGWNPFWADNWYYGGGGWYGYYSPFYNPYFGYGGGYWNGYYDGWYNGHHNGYAGRYNYAPRGLRQSGRVRGIGNYGRNSRTTPLTRTSNTVTPQRATASTRLTGMENGGNRQPVNGGGGVRLGHTRVYNNNLSGNGSQRALDMDRGQSSPANNTEVRVNRRVFRFNRDNDNSRSVPEQRTYRTYSPPVRSSEPSRSSYTPPARDYNTPSRNDYSAPSRSYSPPSRSSGSSSSRSMRR